MGVLPDYGGQRSTGTLLQSWETRSTKGLK